jgi:hypothetical protein
MSRGKRYQPEQVVNLLRQIAKKRKKCPARAIHHPLAASAIASIPWLNQNLS